ncbi:hypothetical protein FACS18948_4440 [Clostridia bacterium]|nr:hypothetical protein FACS18948_4440 [Clostridia bacterium]
MTRGLTGLSKIRGGARAALDASGLVPERREIIAYTDILRFKVGDGITTIALLPYAGIGQPSPYIPGNLVTFDPSTDSLIDTGVSITDVTTYA